MNKRLHLIYVPGLGDSRVDNQRLLVKSWRIWGVESELFQMKWANNEPLENKNQRLLAKIDELNDAGKVVALVGASAGGSAVINAFAQRKDKIVGCVLICGKINHPGTIGRNFSSKNPDLIASVTDSEKALANLNPTDRLKILSRYAFKDEIVSKKDSYIEGAKNQMVPSVGHFFTIATQLMFGAASFTRFLKLISQNPTSN